jgi:hypothetical protein
VGRTFERTAAEVVDISVGAETITATPEHPFRVVGVGWTAAGELRRGSALLTKGGLVVHVDSVERRRGAFKVYNFEVTSTHTYFVGQVGLLVHNDCTKIARQLQKELGGGDIVRVEPKGAPWLNKPKTLYPSDPPWVYRGGNKKGARAWASREATQLIFYREGWVGGCRSRELYWYQKLWSDASFQNSRETSPRLLNCTPRQPTSCG